MRKPADLFDIKTSLQTFWNACYKRKISAIKPYLPNILSIKPKKPLTRSNFISNFSSTLTEISKISSLIVQGYDNTTNIARFIPYAELVHVKIM